MSTMAGHLANQSVEGARCRVCGDTNVAWVQSKRTGRWYLAYAYSGAPGQLIPQPERPHFKVCPGRTGGA